MTKPRLIAAACVLACILAPRVSHAQPPPTLKDAQRQLDAGKADDALATLDRVEASLGPAGDRRSLAAVRLVRASVFWNRAALDQCEGEAKAAEQLAKGIDAAAEAQAIWMQGHVASARGDEKARLAMLLRAQPLARQSGDGRREAMVSDGFCRHYQRINEIPQALPHCDAAIVSADKAGDTEYTIMSRALKATVLLGVSRYDEALATAQDAYDLARERTETQPRVRAAAIWTLAQVNTWLRNLDVAVRLFDEAEAEYRRLGFKPGLFNAVQSRQDALIPLGEYDRAIADGNELLANEATQPAGRTPERLSRQALAYARAERPSEALALIAEAESRLEIQRPQKDLQFLHNNLGLALLAAGQPARALPYFHELVGFTRQRGDIDFEWRAMYGYGRALLASGRPADAIPWLESAIALSEHVRVRLPDMSQRAAYMSDAVQIYEFLVAAIAARSSASAADAERTLEISEASRARTMADQLAEARLRSRDPALRELLKRESEWTTRLTDVQRRILQATGEEERAALLASLASVETDYANYVSRLRRDEPAYARIAHPVRFEARQIRQSLRPGETFVEYLCSDAGGFAWIVTRDRIVSFRIPGRSALESSARLMRALVLAGDQAATRKVGAALYQQLLAPGAELLSGATRLVIAADGPLLRLPFALLSADGRGWLVQDVALSLAPSATILSQLSSEPRSRATRPVMAFAAASGASTVRAAGVFALGALPSTGLPNAAGEARAIASLLEGGSVRVGDNAREQDVKVLGSSSYRMVHFATHAVVDEVVPRRSAIVMAPDASDDGLLQLHEIAALSLDADLVVLSACRSYSGRTIRGEGLASLGRAFLQGGARAVLASVWDVDDRTSPDLMRAFYAAIAGGAAPDTALRTAQLQMLRSGGPNAEISAWAGFMVMGAASEPLFPPAGPTRGATSLTLGLSAIGGMLALGTFRRGRRAS